MVTCGFCLQIPPPQAPPTPGSPLETPDPSSPPCSIPNTSMGPFWLSQAQLAPGCRSEPNDTDAGRTPRQVLLFGSHSHRISHHLSLTPSLLSHCRSSFPLGLAQVPSAFELGKKLGPIFPIWQNHLLPLTLPWEWWGGALHLKPQHSPLSTPSSHPRYIFSITQMPTAVFPKPKSGPSLKSSDPAPTLGERY